jgi:hypothetical protein
MGDNFTVYHPGGGKYAGVVVPGDQWSEGAIKDNADFNTLPYLFSANVGWATPSTTGGATTWRHTPNPDAPETMKTLVVQEGVAGAVETYRNVAIPDLDLSFTRKTGVAVGGKSLGKKVVLGSSLTSATRIPKMPLNGTKGGWWTADTFAHLGSAAIRLDPYGYDGKWSNNGRFGPHFPVDDSQPSFAGLLEGTVAAPFTLMMGFDVNGSDVAGPLNFNAIDVGQVIYLRYQNTGPLISGIVFYSLIIDMALMIVQPPKKGQQGNLKTYDWTCELVTDDTAGVPFDITVINTLPSL